MSRVKKLPFDAFQHIYSLVPRLCVDLIIRKNRKIVFSQRDIPPAKGTWHLPGGTVLLGEKVIDTINRVAMEETGFSVIVDQSLGYLEYGPKSALGQVVSLVFSVTPIGGTLRGSHQAQHIAFFSRIPKPVIHEQKTFILQHRLLR